MKTDGHGTTEPKTGVVHLSAEKHQGLLISASRYEEARMSLPAVAETAGH
jgi:hypothetical protein